MYCIFHKFKSMRGIIIVRLVGDKGDEEDYYGLKAVEAFSWYFHFINMLMSCSSSCIMTHNDALGCVATFLEIAT